MRKSTTFKMLLLGSVFMLSAGVNAQNIQRGNLIIDPYYGGPNFGKKIISSVQDNNNNFSSTGKNGAGPYGIRAEYMLADKFGLGVDVILNSFNADLRYDSLNSDGSLYKVYQGSLNMTRLRVQARFNYHFVTTESVDAYIGVGAGTNTRFWAFKSNDPSYNFNGTRTGTLLPVSMRVAVGMRYYFIPNLGINAEIGLGGPVISAGLSFKI